MNIFQADAKLKEAAVALADADKLLPIQHRRLRYGFRGHSPQQAAINDFLDAVKNYKKWVTQSHET